MEDSCYYNLSESFFEKQFTLIGKHSSSGQLHRGHYLLPFRLTLPTDLPSTFHHRGYGLHGRVIYILEVEVSISGLLRRKLKSDATELILRQLSKDPIMPLQMIDEVFMPSFWCVGGTKIELAIALDKNVYSPGEKVSLKFALNCPLENDVKYIQISLIRTIRIWPLDRCRRETKVIGRSIVKRIKGRIIERRTAFLIPESGPFTLQGKLIECQYELQFKLRAYWCYSRTFIQKILVNDSLLPTYQMATFNIN